MYKLGWTARMKIFHKAPPLFLVTTIITLFLSTTMVTANVLMDSSSSSESSSIDSMNGSTFIVTGATANHFDVLTRSLLPSIRTFNNPQNPSTVYVYDLGLTSDQVQLLAQTYREVRIRTFQFDNYPIHFNVTTDNNYAWKPLAMEEVRQEVIQRKEYPNEDYTILLWLDAGDGVAKPLSTLFNYVIQHHVLTPMSVDDVQTWTHPDMISYMKIPFEDVATKNNCMSGLVGLNIQNASIVEHVLQPWVDCAMVKACIAPDGSSRLNHRQDQAALTLIMLQYGIECKERRGKFGIRIHVNEIAQTYVGNKDLSLEQVVNGEGSMKENDYANNGIANNNGLPVSVKVEINGNKNDLSSMQKQQLRVLERQQLHQLNELEKKFQTLPFIDMSIVVIWGCVCVSLAMVLVSRGRKRKMRKILSHRQM